MKETIEIEVPSGKKVKVTPMESGTLFAFEEKTNSELIQESIEYVHNEIFKLMGVPKIYFGNVDLDKLKCNDYKYIIFMIEKYFTIYDNKIGEYIPFKLMDHQKLILKSFVENNGTIIKSYRQGGNTVLKEAFLACQMILNGNTNILLLSSRLELSSEFIDHVRKFIGQWSKAANKTIFYHDIDDKDWVVRNEKEIKLLSGANIKVINPRAERLNIPKSELDKVTHVIYDNAAFIDFNDNLLYELGERLPKNIKTIITSTDQKTNNWFKTKWNKIYKLNNNINGNYDCGEFNKIELEWFNDPRFNKDLKWVKVQQNVIENGVEKVKQAYLPTNEWYVGMCRCFSNNKARIEQEVGIGFNPNENPIEIEKEDIREQILELNNRLQNLKKYE